MKPPRFAYQRAETVDEACATLAEFGGDARILAGGQSLVPMLNFRLSRPKFLVDISRVEGLEGTHRFPPPLAQGEGESSVHLLVPATLRQQTLLAWPGLSAASPLLAAALPWVGHVQTRARGTVCGSIAHADPSAELPLCLVAVRGEVRLRSARRRRTLLAEDFVTGMMTTACAEDELIEAVVFPARKPHEHHAFREFARRRGDFAIVAAAAIVSRTGIRLAIGGVADRPMARDWPMLEGSALDDALNAFAWELDARDDQHASARLRRDLVRSLGRAVVEEAKACRA